MSFFITQSALAQIQKNLESQTTKIIRIGIKKSGCSGFKYYIDFADKILESDLVLNATLFKNPEIQHLAETYQNIHIISDTTHLEKLDHVTLDYTKQGLNSSFKFSNPKAIAECGCGESFSL